MDDELKINTLTEVIVGEAIEVHRQLGPDYWSRFIGNALLTNCSHDVIEKKLI